MWRTQSAYSERSRSDRSRSRRTSGLRLRRQRNSSLFQLQSSFSGCREYQGCARSSRRTSRAGLHSALLLRFLALGSRSRAGNAGTSAPCSTSGISSGGMRHAAGFPRLGYALLAGWRSLSRGRHATRSSWSASNSMYGMYSENASVLRHRLPMFPASFSGEPNALRNRSISKGYGEQKGSSCRWVRPFPLWLRTLDGWCPI